MAFIRVTKKQPDPDEGHKLKCNGQTKLFLYYKSRWSPCHRSQMYFSVSAMQLTFQKNLNWVIFFFVF